jgi:hypothetical protein
MNFRVLKFVKDVKDLQRGESNHLGWGNQNVKEIMSTKEFDIQVLGGTFAIAM